MVCGPDAVKVRRAAPIYLLSRAELGGAIRSSVNSFLDPVRDTLAVSDVEEREDAKGSDQPEADRSCDHQLFFFVCLGQAFAASRLLVVLKADLRFR